MKIVYHTVIRDATRHGIKPACRTYEIARNTVRKWVRRAKEDEPLTNRSTRPHNSPNAMIPYWRLKTIDEAQKERARLVRYRAPKCGAGIGAIFLSRWCISV